jgi:serine protease Do
MSRIDQGPAASSPSWVSPRTKTNFKRWNVAALSVAALLGLGLVTANYVPGLQGKASAAAKVPLKIDKDPAAVSLADFKNGYAPIIGPALPAVVNISTTKVVKAESNLPSSMLNDPFFRRFFSDPSEQGHGHSMPQSQKEHSLGSGVIVNPDGYILTNDHVISGASDIEVFTQDKKKFKATLVGTDSMTDIAVLKIDAKNLPSLTLGDSSKLKVGDMVFAIGDPFGIGETATMGIVSATGRGLGGAIEHYENFIQTDAAINPGNSGGALLDLHGDLIGINTAILTGNGGGGGNQGVGFAIPINMANNVMEQIVEHGKVVRGHLGIAIQGVDADMAKAFGLTQGGGALVSDVTPGSPAAKAGIERGDIILALNGETINGPEDLSVNVSQIAPGSTVHLKLARNGQTHDLTATLGEMEEKDGDRSGKEEKSSTTLGIQVDNLTPSIAKELGVNSPTGVVVTSVDPSSAAAAADLQQGDVIQEVNRKPVKNVNEYKHALESGNNQAVLLLINRHGTSHFLVVSPQ